MKAISDHQVRCTATTALGPCKNWAKSGEFCRQHAPELAEVRSKWAGTRSQRRFSTGVRVDGVALDRATVPTTMRIVDALLDVADDVRSGELTAADGKTVTSALTAALNGLWKERDAAAKAQASPEFAAPAEGETADPSLEEALAH